MEKKDSNVKIIDIAKEAGVSTATVCRVINEKGNVTKEISYRVQRAIDKLGYQPHRIHKKNEKSPWIVLVTDSNINTFYSEVLTAIQSTALERGYLVYVLQMPQNTEKHTEIFRQIRQQSWTGLISAGFYQSPEEWIRVQEQIKIPVVVMNTSVNHPKIAYLQVDFKAAISNVLRHLIDLGHKKIAYLGDLNDQFSRQELEGVENSLNEKGYSYPEEYRFSVPHTLEGASQGISRIMMLPKELRPTAIISFDDEFAINLMNALRYYKLKVPEDISLVGFDNIPMSARTYPTLTTVDVPKYRIGQQLVELLMQLIESNEGQHVGNIIIDGSLVVRTSTGLARN
jgi:DNA-binding LacI/PurR family transcriptional regulator